MRSTPLRRTYSDFRGVDFANDPSLVLLSRSPDAVNVWKNYQDTQGSCIESRPGYRKMAQFKTTVGNEEVGEKINGMFFYNNTVLVHAGTHLYLWNNFPNTPEQVSDITTLKSNMNNAKSSFSIFNEKLYIVDGANYLVYDGTSLCDVFDTQMEVVQNPTGNPFENRYYEKTNTQFPTYPRPYYISKNVIYLLTADTSVVSGTTYYKMVSEPYVPTTTISRSPSGRRRALSRRKRTTN